MKKFLVWFSLCFAVCAILASCGSKPPKDFSYDVKVPPFSYSFHFESDGSGTYEITNRDVNIKKRAALSWKSEWNLLPWVVDYYEINLQYGVYFTENGTESLYIKDGYLYPSYSAMSEKRSWERLKF